MPPNPPAKLFWSVTVYELDVRTLVQNKEQIPDNVSRQDLVKDADGSVDLYLGPTAPKGHEKTGFRPCPAEPGLHISASMARSHRVST